VIQMKDDLNKGQALLGAGCFWGVQHYFDQVPGVTGTVVGYTGGDAQNPTYEMVCSGKTGHAETVSIEFDGQIVDYETLLQHFFRIHDPTQINRQGPDIGDQYRSVIFYTNDAQLQIAQAMIEGKKQAYAMPIATELRPASAFYPAEEYHQKFTQKTGRGACHVSYHPQG